MNVETINIADLTPDPSNVRRHNDRNLDAIKASLVRFDQQRPIIVDANGVVVAGNGTLAAARALGWESIDVVRTELTGAEATAYAIADNRSSELAEWDQEDLTRQLEALRDDDALEGVGFTMDEVAKMLSPESSDDPSGVNIPEVFQVVVQCDDEDGQMRAYQLLEKEGFKCRVSTL